MEHKARKRFGQNFLHDPNIIDKIISAIAPQRDDVMLEIGPGLGAITRPLAAKLEHLNVVELDRDLVTRLEADEALFPKLTIYSQDALTLSLSDINKPNDKKIRVVGNLPYNISTPLIFHLLQQVEHIHDMHFMLQKEVIERMAAEPGNKQYGRLTVMLAWHCRVIPLIEVKPGAFNPPPKVDSAVVRLVPHSIAPFEIGNYDAFSAVVTAAFGQRRKTLRNALSKLLSEEQILAAGVKPTLRAEQLAPVDFGKLAVIASQL